MAAAAGAAQRRPVQLSVTFDGKPIQGIQVSYLDDGILKATTDERGIAVLQMTRVPELISFQHFLNVDSPDFVLRDFKSTTRGFTAVAQHRAQWYRDLMIEAAGVNAGECVSDWERWWSAKGYAAVPDPIIDRSR